jgi:glucokinase
MMENLLAIGIDMGGTGTKFGIVSPAGKILEQSTLPTAAFETAEGLADALATELLPMIARHGGKERFSGVGIGAPNGNFYNGNIEHAPNLRWKGIIPFAKFMETRLGLPARLTNDANAAAVGEMIYGAARGMTDFIVVTLGTGLGSGIVSQGKVVYGKTGSAGELGHVTVVKNGRPCGCGRNGCLETYASATGLSTSAKEILGKELAASEVSRLANAGSAEARKIFEETGMILGEALANAVALFSPEAIFLFGGVANAGELIFAPTREHLEKNCLQIFKHSVKVLPSGLNENDAAILGAAALVSA